jgi:hypothetical protein
MIMSHVHEHVAACNAKKGGVAVRRDALPVITTRVE